MSDSSKVITVVPERSSNDAPIDLPQGWWPRYRLSAANFLSTTALEVLEVDARYIVERALPTTASGIDSTKWAADGLRTGMVVGSVQSGKTASMLAVAGLALDVGVDVVILLAGTRVGLWLQTYERMLAQLDGSTLDTAYSRSADRLILPMPEDVLSPDRLGPRKYLKPSMARLAVRNGLPIIIVVPKLDEHLLHLARMLADVLSPKVLDARAAPTTMLVLDDEADDASVLDSSASDKVTPRFIAALWSGNHHRSSSRHPKLLATYLAYTATPQANYLQESHNPLAPRNFSAALRVAGQEGNVMPRLLTYREPAGIAGYYCGGDLYYEAISYLPGSLTVVWPNPVAANTETGAEFAQRQEDLRQEMLSRALRSHLVGAAVKLLFGKKRYSDVMGKAFATKAELDALTPATHTMMLHPSARKDAQFSAAEDISKWSRATPGEEAKVELPEDEYGEPIVAIDSAGLASRLSAEENEWQACLRSFEASRLALSSFALAPYPKLDDSLWPELRKLLVEQIFPNVAIRVLNSDPAADDRPRFEAYETADGWQAPADLLTIFVAGNILSRGLTVEGLATSLFLRSTSEPAADTQMQMQRWFGYRGSYLPICRVFLLEDQLNLFRQYNVQDKALKSLILKRMAMPTEEELQSTLVLEGQQFVATSKVDTRKVPLSPGPSPQIRLVERIDPKLARSNTGLLLAALAEGDWDEIDPARQVGTIRREPASLLEVAKLLEGLRYSRHDPAHDDEMSRRWVSLQHALGLEDTLFRPPGVNPQPYDIRPQSCPYAIAAYLRLWAALAGGRHAPGFHATDKPDLPWSQIDGRNPPSFYIAVRSGNIPSTEPILRKLKISAMTRGIGPLDRLNTLWGSRGYDSSGYHGDQLVDYHFHARQPVPRLQGGETWRPRGHPGLVLFHVIHDNAGGPDLITLGLGLPHGGPDHIAALRR